MPDGPRSLLPGKQADTLTVCPMYECHRMWQCSGQMPGLLAVNLMTTQLLGGRVTVSRRMGLYRLRLGSSSV
jgi:hypothetical protein